MTSHDVRDVLNLPADGTPRPAKKAKTSAPRHSLKGLAREVQSLGGDNPIAIVPPTSVFKKRRLGSRKPTAKWTMAGFMNSAREDTSLILRHWRRQEDQPSNGVLDGENREMENGDDEKKAEKMHDSAFAKFNVEIPLPQYNEDQYNSNLQNPDWTKDETDYLLGLVRDFDQRWSLIWDRYDYKPPKREPSDDPMAPPAPELKERDIDGLKARYYEVAASMMVVNKPKQYMTIPEFNLYETMANFNASAERARRKFAVDSLSRSKEEAREEESLLLEVKRILARAEQLNEQRRELYQRLDFPPSESDVQSFKSSAGLQQLLQNLMAVDKSKKRKSMMENGVSPGTPAGPESAGGFGHGRRESAALSHRDSIGADSAAPTPTSTRPSAKKNGAASLLQQQAERRKLSETEEVVYGVSHHDRLTGGATFRYEKINKLFSHKSGQQQQRITNVLTELGIPARLVMPTGAVVARFEALIQHVNTLLDTRKVSDKMEVELKTENAKRDARRELEAKALATKQTAGEKKGAEEEGAAAAAVGDGEQEVPGEEGRRANVAASAGDGESQGAATSANGDGAEGDVDITANANPEGPALEQADPPIKEEAASRPGSSGQKRSASVLGNSDDDRSKRQKK